MKALVFPGQGSQFVGMGLPFYEKSEESKKIIDLADSMLGYTLSKIMWDGPLDVLTKTSHAQPALLTVSIAMLQCFLEEKNTKIEEVCSFAAGHSLGEYSALVAANVLSFEDALMLVQLRGELMESSFNGKGAMAAILNFDYESLVSCLPANQSCVIANDNAPGQIVISGEEKSVKAVIDIAIQKGAKRCIQLPVSNAFHSPYMLKAQEKMERAIEKTSFKDASIPVISNVLAKSLIIGEDIKQHLKKQICGQVRWRESILYLYNKGVRDIIEIGAGSVLTGLNKRIIPDCICTSYQNL